MFRLLHSVSKFQEFDRQSTQNYRQHKHIFSISSISYITSRLISRSSRISLLENGQIMIFFALNHDDDDDHFVIIIESRFSFYDVLIQFQMKREMYPSRTCYSLENDIVRDMCEMNEPRFEKQIVLKRDREREETEANSNSRGREVEEEEWKIIGLFIYLTSFRGFFLISFLLYLAFFSSHSQLDSAWA